VNEKRADARRRVLKTAFIIFSDKAPKLECTVRNLSESGATLQLSTTVGIPKTIDLVIEGVRRQCRIVWRIETQIGTRFL